MRIILTDSNHEQFVIEGTTFDNNTGVDPTGMEWNRLEDEHADFEEWVSDDGEKRNAPTTTSSARRLLVTEYYTIDLFGELVTELPAIASARRLGTVAVRNSRGRIVYTVPGAGKQKCDDRCTHAKGNECTCRCGGKNHSIYR